jgi:O-methyltransferase
MIADRRVFLSVIVTLAKQLGERVALPIVRRVRLLRELAAYVDDNLGPNGYGLLKKQFIINGKHSRWPEGVRKELVDRFERIQRHIEIHSKPADALVMAEALLSLTAAGAMVECGCFAGGSTAKLSILAKLLGKPLFVFDSFEGLPVTSPQEAVDHHGRSTRIFRWASGANRASLEQVKANVETYGEISVCTFNKGWFSNTLTPEHLPTDVSFTYTDVVLASSARDCLRALWPLLCDGGVYFSRDVGFTKVLQALLDERLWREELHAFPPILFGAGYGMCDAAPYLGFMVKGRSLPAEYIDSLMIEKPSTG